MAYKIKKTILYIVLIALAGICLLPFALMLVNATRSGNEIMTSFSLLPGSSLASNWKVMTPVRQGVLATACSSRYSAQC